MTNKEKAEVVNKIIVQLISTEPYFKKLKEVEDSKEAYKDIIYTEMVLEEVESLLRSLENQYFQSQ